MSKKEHDEQQIQNWEEHDKRRLQGWEELSADITRELKAGNEKIQHILVASLYDDDDVSKTFGTLVTMVLVNTRDTPKDAPKD